MGFLYMLTSPSGKSYIGQTIRPIEERLKEHKKNTTIVWQYQTPFKSTDGKILRSIGTRYRMVI